jgi:hypothetical protein
MNRNYFNYPPYPLVSPVQVGGPLPPLLPQMLPLQAVAFPQGARPVFVQTGVGLVPAALHNKSHSVTTTVATTEATAAVNAAKKASAAVELATALSDMLKNDNSSSAETAAIKATEAADLIMKAAEAAIEATKKATEATKAASGPLVTPTNAEKDAKAAQEAMEAAKEAKTKIETAKTLFTTVKTPLDAATTATTDTADAAQSLNNAIAEIKLAIKYLKLAETAVTKVTEALTLAGGTPVPEDLHTKYLKDFMKLNYDLNLRRMIYTDNQRYYEAHMKYYNKKGRNKVKINSYPISYNSIPRLLESPYYNFSYSN